MTKDKQKKSSAASRQAQEEELETEAQIAEKKEPGELDELLDEIDTLLESNAEEFVASYVQKGGE